MKYHFIPITKESCLSGKSAYLYCLAAAEAMIDYQATFTPPIAMVSFLYDSAVFRRKGVKYGITTRTLSTFEDTFFSPITVNANFIVMMSPKAWLFLNEWFLKDELPTRTRTTYTRVYLYFYYWIIAMHGSYSRPFTRIVADLAITHDKLTEAINWLCSHKLLFHSTYTFNNDENRARTYFVPMGLWPDNFNPSKQTKAH